MYTKYIQYMSVLAPTILPMKLPLKRLLQYFRLHTYVAELDPTILPMKLLLIDVATILYTTYIICLY